ncbi:hypothetical protein TCAL_13255 [Tigriopus californicus]|uniref:Apple domain-containing protein n=1 Tax=Tigriopus californicus TaxID=6832 RepID=A0A553PDM3_TIGCA|nr:hypothetical protein TCAL_13255 [Tigriopus californicus]
MNGTLLAFSSLLILAKCLVIDGCEVNGVRCKMLSWHRYVYRPLRTYQHVESSEGCFDLCTKILESGSKANYFTYYADILVCRCSEKCLIDREEGDKRDVTDIEEDGDALISFVQGGQTFINPVSKDSYCNTKANRDAAIFFVSQFDPRERPAIFFNKDEVVFCGIGTVCRAFVIKQPRKVHPTYGLKDSRVNQMPVTFLNGTTWLLGGIDMYSKKPLTSTQLYHSDRTVTSSSVAMPQPMTVSCSVRIGDSQIFLVDGLSGDCFMLDTMQRYKWIPLPKMLSPKTEKLICAVAKNSGDPVVIVDGWKGKTGENKASQIFHVASQTWSYAPGETNYVIPYRSSMMSLGNSVISVGGFVNDDAGNQVKNSWIRMYDLKTGDWVVRGPELPIPIGEEITMLASKSLEMCKPKTEENI